MATIKMITLNPPVETNHPTWEWWTMTTDADARMGNPALTIGVEMDATADAIATEITAEHLRSENHTADCDDSLRGERVVIYLTAPDGTETEHEAVYS